MTAAETYRGFYELPAGLAADIDEYAHDVTRFLKGELAPGIFKARRVPRGIYEQRRNGSYMVRARVAGGRLAPDQLRALADLAAGFGSGSLHVTTRQDMQMHDVPIERTPEVLRGLLAAGLTSKGGGGNTVRNVTACPLAGLCPAERFDVTPSALAVTEYLIAQKGSYNLPRKYKIAFSGCSADCALARVNDVGFVARVRDGRAGFAVYAGGGMGAYSRLGDLVEEWVPAEDVVRVAEAWRRFFDRHGNRQNKHRARLRFVFDDRGPEACREECRGLLAGLKAEGVPDALPTPPGGISSNDWKKDGWIFQWLENVRVIPQRQDSLVVVPVFLPLGIVGSADAHKLADIAARFSAGLRTTPEQNVLLCNVVRADVPKLAAALKELSFDGLTWRPLNHFVTCAGAATCRLGLCLSRNASVACAQSLEEAGIGASTMKGLDVRINGCSNACGQSPIGTIGLAGVAHRVGNHIAPAYRVLLGGRRGETAARLAEPAGLIPARMLGKALSALLTDFERQRRSDEAFADFCDRESPGHFKELLAPFEEFPPYEEHPEFYRDLGQDEEFSLAGRGAGECGAGVFEVIQEDLVAARKGLDQLAQAADQRAALLDILVVSARALLIVRGVDTQKPDEVLRAFERHFVETKLVPEGHRDLLARGWGVMQGWREALDGREKEVRELLERVELLFGVLDSNLEFHLPDGAGAPPPEKKTADAAAELDLRGVACPMNFVKAKLKLETLSAGQTLVLTLDDGEPIRNVPESFRGEGQEVLQITDIGQGCWRVLMVILAMPDTMSLERRKVLKALGARIILTEGAKGMIGAVQEAERLVAGQPGHFFMPQQFKNPANPAIHEKTTAPEIEEALGRAPDVFVSGVGTGGTITGVSRYFKRVRGQPLVSVAVEPEASPILSQKLAGQEIKPGPHRIQGIGAGFIPDILDLSLVDRVERVSNEAAFEYARRLAAEEGILAGISSGAAVAVAVRLAQDPSFAGKSIVAVLPDSGERYLSTDLYDA